MGWAKTQLGRLNVSSRNVQSELQIGKCLLSANGPRKEIVRLRDKLNEQRQFGAAERVNRYSIDMARQPQ